MRTLLAMLLIGVTASMGAAQVEFRADLTGDQEVPPVNTRAFGWGHFTLNANDTVTYRVETSALKGTAAHIHVGKRGQNGGVLIALQGGDKVWSGTTAPLSASDVAALQSDGLYVNVHTQANPAGEIRGQIEARPVQFGAHLTGAQEVPPVSTRGVGDATFVVNPDRTITYSVTARNVTATAAHIHVGGFGQSGGVLFPLSGGPTAWSGTTPAMSPAQFTSLQTGNLYVNVHSATNPAGEIRGQIHPSGVPYGVGCPRATGPASLLATGAPVTGGTIELRVTGGRPGAPGFLVASFLPDADDVLNCPVLIETAVVFAFLPVGLDGSGQGGLKLLWPGSPSAIDVYFQFLGLDGSAPAGFYTTNGLLLPITNR